MEIKKVFSPVIVVHWSIPRILRGDGSTAVAHLPYDRIRLNDVVVEGSYGHCNIVIIGPDKKHRKS